MTKLSSLRSLHRIHWREMIQPKVGESCRGSVFGKDSELEDVVYLLHKYLKYSYF